MTYHIKEISWDFIWSQHSPVSTIYEKYIRYYSSSETEKMLEAHLFEKHISDWRNNSKMSLSLRKELYGGTLSWDKLKFSEKYQIWGNLRAGGPEAWCFRRGRQLQVTQMSRACIISKKIGILVAARNSVIIIIKVDI